MCYVDQGITHQSGASQSYCVAGRRRGEWGSRMPHYCDTKVLEQNWFNWLVAEATPALDEYRQAGLLVTKVLSAVAARPNQNPNPFWGYPDEPRRAHCIVVDRPVFCNSYSGRCDKPRYFSGSRPVICELPPPDSILSQVALDKMLAQGYVLERPAMTSWTDVLLDVQKICKGISLKFNLPSEEAHEELASEAFVQVINKIKNRKLVFTPGLAPVFNLLTTTIHRIMFSLLNKSNRERENRAEHAQLVTPLIARGQGRLRGRIVTRRVFGSLTACSSR